MKLIGLTAPAGDGKDTVTEFLCDTQGFVPLAFADPIRSSLKSMLGLNDEHFNDRVKKETAIPWIGLSPRELMRLQGDWMRQMIDPEILIYLASSKLDRIGNLPASLHVSGVVLSDVRLNGEASWLRRRGGELWHIRRASRARQRVTKATHITEQGVGFCDGDRIIHNDGSIEQLLEDVGEIFTNEETS